METTVPFDRTSVIKQTKRAAELIEAAISVLREDAPAGGALEQGAERLRRVATSLKEACRSIGADLPRVVQKSASTLEETLTLIGDPDALGPRQAQSVEALVRSQGLLMRIAAETAEEIATPTRSSRKPNEPSPQERRRSPRVILETEIDLGSDNNFYTGFTEDISEGGIFIVTYDLKPLGTEMELKFTLPNGHTVTARGTVRWLRDPRDLDADTKPGMGIQFAPLSEQDTTAITEFIRARAPLFYAD